MTLFFSLKNSMLPNLTLTYGFGKRFPSIHLPIYQLHFPNKSSYMYGYCEYNQ